MAKRPKLTDADPAAGAEAKSIADEKYPRRSERRRRTRANILAAAGELFRAAGYGSTTMQAIADAADIHVTTLFMHFNSKSELALSLVAARIDTLRDKANALSGTMSVFDFIRNEALDQAKDLGRKTGGGPGLWHALYTDQELAFAWSEYEREQKSIIANLVAREFGLDPATDMRPEIVANLLLSSAFLPHRKWADGSARVNLADEVARSASIGEHAARAILETAS